MFQSVRQNGKVYILHKNDNPSIEIGVVSSNPVVRPKYAIPQTFGRQDMVVDLTVSTDSGVSNFKDIPASLDIADLYIGNECVTLSDSRDAINAEVLSLKKRSQDIIDGCERNKTLVAVYDDILREINPEFAEKQAQRDEIDLLKTQMKTISDNMNELMNTNRLLVEKLSVNKEG